MSFFNIETWIALPSSTRPSVGTANVFSSLMQAGEKKTVNDGEWSKVEKRKAKKARKVEEKAEVCIVFLCNVPLLKESQLSPPRFFYVNSEIVKRREAITIGVRVPGFHLATEYSRYFSLGHS